MPGIRTTLLMLILALALGIAWLISTTAGARWATERLDAWVPALNAEFVEGDLWQGLRLADVSWRDGAVAAQAQQVEWRWDPWCLIQGQSCTHQLQVSKLVLADRAIGDVELRLQGALQSHVIQIVLPSAPMQLEGRLEGGFNLETRRWQGILANAQLDGVGGPWRMSGQPQLLLDLRRSLFRLEPHCWVQDAVNLCTEPLVADRESARLGVNLSAVSLARFADQWPPGLQVSGDMTGTAVFSWRRGGSPEARVTLVSPGGVVELTPADDEPSFPLRYRRLVVDADLRADRADLRLGVASPDIGNGGFAITTTPLAPTRPLSGVVWLDGLPLAPLAGWLPQISRISGAVAARGEVAGTMANPRFIGELSLADASVLPRALAAPITAIEARATVEGTNADIRGAFQLGAGQGEISGEIDWTADGLRGVLNLRGDQLELKPGAVTRLTVTPDLALRLGPDERLLTGQIAVPAGEINLDTRLGRNLARVSADTVRVDAAGQPLSAPDSEAGMGLRSELQLVFGPSVQISAGGLTGRLNGELAVRQAGDAAAEAEGVLALLDAQYSAYGQTLSVRRGRLIFAGPVDNPRLDIEAVRESADLLAGLRVSGPAQDPQLVLFSRPPMEQASILSYLITGRPPGQGTPNQEALVGEAALALGVFGGEQIGSALAEEVGIRDFQLEASGQGETAEVAVSGYLAPNLMLRYGVGVFEPENTLTLRYYLRPRLYLEAVSGAEGAFDLFYSFDYD